jgi:DoxX-like protein
MRTIAQNNLFVGTNVGGGLTSRAGSRRQLWAGRAVSGLAVLLLIFDSAGKLLQVQPVIDGTIQLGYPPDVVFSLGVILLASVVTYVIPGTSVLGALLLTGYLGGAVATNVRVENPVLRQNRRGAVAGHYRDVSGVDRPDAHDDWQA